MRLLFALLYDLVALLLAVLAAPLSLLRRRPEWLLLEVSGDLPWRAGRRPRWRPGGSRRRPLAIGSLRLLEEKLREAARDPAVRGVVVRVEGFEGPGSRLDAVRAALARFAQAGKEVVTYGRAVSMREYALMACGSRVFAAPGGRIDLKGYAAELFVLGETLGRVGVKAHFLRRASHKTAPELFTDREVSEAQRETTLSFLEDATARAIGLIAEGRKRPAEQVRAWIDAGPYTAAEALEKGLVDAIGDGEEIELALGGGAERRARTAPLSAYRGASRFWRPRLKRLRRRPAVGVVRVDGVIKLGESVHLPWAPRAAGSDTVVAALRRARDDDAVKAVVLAIDSRGGSALASELIRRAVRRLAEKKPVVAFVDHIAASGGYMAAVGAREIVAARASITGSIGVFGGKFEISGLLDRLGVGRAVLKLGKHAALESAFQPWTDDERAALDREIEQTYREFLKVVAEGRRKDVGAIEPLAGGRVYTGARAREAGLVDALGGFEDAVGRAAALAGLPAEPDVVAVEVPSRPLSGLSGVRGLADAWGSLAALAQERVFAIEEFPIRTNPKL